jgi:hypothetical protein
MNTGALSQRIARYKWYSLVVGVAATIGCIIGALFDWEQFLRAYLYSYLFLLGLSLGGLALVMIHNLTGGAWGLLIRRFAEAQMKMLPLMAILSLPIAFGLRHIYTWASIYVDQSESQEYLFWGHYLEPWFFYLRGGCYFVIWLALMVILSGWSRTQDREPNVRSLWRAYKASGFGLVVLGVSLHFAAMDWIMSLQPGFTSTIFGPLIFTNEVLSSYALCVALFCWIVARRDFEKFLSSKAMNDLGSLLFTILILWAYLSWFQFMLIWMADLPHGNVWYLVRWREPWGIVGSILIVFQFVIPFFVLLLRVVKQSLRALGLVAAMIFIGQWIFMYYQTVPLFGFAGWAHHWMDLLMPIGLGGIWFAGFSWLLNRRLLLPIYDLNYEQARLLREIDLGEMAREEAVAHE